MWECQPSVFVLFVCVTQLGNLLVKLQLHTAVFYYWRQSLFLSKSSGHTCTKLKQEESQYCKVSTSCSNFKCENWNGNYLFAKECVETVHQKKSTRFCEYFILVYHKPIFISLSVMCLSLNTFLGYGYTLFILLTRSQLKGE